MKICVFFSAESTNKGTMSPDPMTAPGRWDNGSGENRDAKWLSLSKTRQSWVFWHLVFFLITSYMYFYDFFVRFDFSWKLVIFLCSEVGDFLEIWEDNSGNSEGKGWNSMKNHVFKRFWGSESLLECSDGLHTLCICNTREFYRLRTFQSDSATPALQIWWFLTAPGCWQRWGACEAKSALEWHPTENSMF